MPSEVANIFLTSYRREENMRTMGNGKITHLDNLVPTARDDDGVHDVGAEAHARYPLGVAILLDIVLALAKGVPELNRPVARAGDNLPVVSAEADRKDVGRVADEAARRETSVKVPEAEGVVPRGGERELAVGGDDDVRDEVVVAVEDAFGVAVRVLVARQLPDDNRLVCPTSQLQYFHIYPTLYRVRTARARQDNIRRLRRGRDASNPTSVAGERADELDA